MREPLLEDPSLSFSCQPCPNRTSPQEMKRVDRIPVTHHRFRNHLINQAFNSITPSEDRVGRLYQLHSFQIENHVESTFLPIISMKIEL